MKKAFLAVLFLVPVGLLAWQDYGPFVLSHLAGRPGASAPASQPARRWAQRVQAPPLENFYRLTDDVYRGAQPDAAGMRRLKEMGIRTVVNLRRFHSDADELRGVGLEAVHINVNPFKPRREQLVEFLRVASDPNRTPVFVHCQRGIDRTGMMCAVYRMAVCGWSRDEAIDEMTNGPFGYDAVFRNVVEFLAHLDVEALRRDANGPR